VSLHEPGQLTELTLLCAPHADRMNGVSGDQGHHCHAGFLRMPRDGQQEHSVGGAGADAGPSHALVVQSELASDGAVDSALPEAQRRFPFEPDAPPNPEGVRIGVLPGQPGREGPELVAADGNFGTPAASRDENLQVWLNDTQDDSAWRDATVHEMREGEG
jgi:hypothetical protein